MCTIIICNARILHTVILQYTKGTVEGDVSQYACDMIPNLNLFRLFIESDFVCFPLSNQVTQHGQQSLAAVWSEKGQVEIFDLQAQLEAVHSSTAMAAFIKQNKEATPLFSFSGHMTEGFAIDWSPKVPGQWTQFLCLLHMKTDAPQYTPSTKCPK